MNEKEFTHYKNTIVPPKTIKVNYQIKFYTTTNLTIWSWPKFLPKIILLWNLLQS